MFKKLVLCDIFNRHLNSPLTSERQTTESIHPAGHSWRCSFCGKDELFTPFDCCSTVKTSPGLFALVQLSHHLCFVIAEDTSTLSLLLSVCRQWPRNVNSALMTDLLHITHTLRAAVRPLSSISAVLQHLSGVLKGNMFLLKMPVLQPAFTARYMLLFWFIDRAGETLLPQTW